MARERKFNRPRGINCRANRHKRYLLRYKNLINRSTVTSVTGSVTLPKSDKPDINMQNGQDAMDQMSRSPSVTVSGIWRSISGSSGLTLRLVRSCDAQSVRPRDGYRLIQLNKLAMHVIDVTVHCIMCPPCKDLVTAGGLPIKFVGEVYRVGLASVVQVECLGCGKDFIMKTSDEVTLGEGSKKVYDVNARAVWGQMSTGGGHSKLEEFSATLGMPCMTARTFSNLEMTIGESWRNILHKELIEAHKEEKAHAIAMGNFHEGVPAITVMCDAGWSKRSHRHTYNAMGGVAIIVGVHTKKLLYVGIKNKYCKICSLAESAGRTAREHVCFRNWEHSSQAMEADAILEGFQCCEQFGVRYMRIVADGDSSVLSTLQKFGPHWCRSINKIECANHACKCLRGKLEKIVDSTRSYHAKGGLDKLQRIRLVSGVRCAIRMRSLMSDRAEAIKLLKADIKNSINHVMGDHSHCSDFCKSANATTSNSSQNINNDDVLNEEYISLPTQENLWIEGSTEGEQQNARNASAVLLHMDENLKREILHYLSFMADKAEKLIGNFTTNLVESWMGLRSKFDGGKIINRCQSGSWNARCHGAGLRKNIGPYWGPIVWEGVTNTKAGMHYWEYGRKVSMRTATYLKSYNNPLVRARAQKRKRMRQVEMRSKKARLAYGPESLQAEDDISSSELDVQKVKYYEEQIKVDESQIAKIEHDTTQQSLSEKWVTERKKRLTGSNFGKVMKRRIKTPAVPLVDNLLYSQFRGNRSTRLGTIQENYAAIEYKNIKSQEGKEVSVELSGLRIDSENNHLAASTDRIITEDGVKGLLEIKHVLTTSDKLILQAAKDTSSFPLCLNSDKIPTLKTTHQFYYQIQGQMNIYKLPWCDIMFRRVNPHDIVILRVSRDSHLWHGYMLPKLNWCFHEAILPELANPRNGKYPGIREPAPVSINVKNS